MAAPLKFSICSGEVSLKITLDEKWQSRLFVDAVVKPFLKNYNSRPALTPVTLLALAKVEVDGVETVVRDKLASDVVRPTTQQVELFFGEEPPREIKLTVCCGETELKITLDRKWQQRPFLDAVVVPFLSIYNKKVASPCSPPQLVEMHVDGAKSSVLKSTISKSVVDVIGYRATLIELFFSWEQVKAKQNKKQYSTMRFKVAPMSRHDMQTCKDLVYDHKQMNAADAIEIAGQIKENAVLKECKYMYFYSNDIRDAGFIALAKVLTKTNCPALKQLHVNANRISNVGVEGFVKEMKPCPDLDVVSLHDNIIGDAGVHALADALASFEIKINTKLTLYGNVGIGPEGRERIQEVCGIAVLDAPIRGTGPTPYIPLDHTPQRWVTADDVKDV